MECSIQSCFGLETGPRMIYSHFEVSPALVLKLTYSLATVEPRLKGDTCNGTRNDISTTF